MTDTKISALTQGTPTGTAQFPYSEAGTTLRASLSTMSNYQFGVTYLISSPAGSTLYAPMECGFAGTIESIRLNSGTIKGNGTVDIYKMTYAQVGTGTPGTAFSMIGTATKPALAGTQIYQGTVFTGWTATTFDKGDWLYPYVTGAGTVTNLSLSILGKKTAVS